MPTNKQAYEKRAKELQLSQGRHNGEAISKALCTEFPELSMASGVVVTREEEIIQHTWCRTKTGSIVDICIDPHNVIFYFSKEKDFNLLGNCQCCKKLVFDRKAGKIKPFVKGGSIFCNNSCYEKYKTER